MTQDLWTEVDRYFADAMLPADPALDAAQEASIAAGLPAISVSPAQGKFLQMLAQLMEARSILEIGTLGGYSTIWLARALGSGGRLITLEVEPKHAEVAAQNIARAGLESVVELRLGSALDSLPRLAQAHDVFDLIFIDADKPNIPAYFEWAVRLSRPGTLIVVDNVVRHGEVVDAGSSDPSVLGVRRLVEELDARTDVSATVLQTVGVKGYDGFALVRVDRRA